jgi:hypothetical protein
MHDSLLGRLELSLSSQFFVSLCSKKHTGAGRQSDQNIRRDRRHEHNAHKSVTFKERLIDTGYI